MSQKVAGATDCAVTEVASCDGLLAPGFLTEERHHALAYPFFGCWLISCETVSSSTNWELHRFRRLPEKFTTEMQGPAVHRSCSRDGTDCQGRCLKLNHNCFGSQQWRNKTSKVSLLADTCLATPAAV